ncbi:hypothetical protein TPA0909_06660 [Streptomyces albus]|nr:hypothetical protein TPA0909_06660 [Streptomyces albus]
MRPHLALIIDLETALAMRKEPARLVSMTSVKSSSRMVGLSASRVMPALEMRTETGPIAVGDNGGCPWCGEMSRAAAPGQSSNVSATAQRTPGALQQIRFQHGSPWAVAVAGLVAIIVGAWRGLR